MTSDGGYAEMFEYDGLNLESGLIKKYDMTCNNPFENS